MKITTVEYQNFGPFRAAKFRLDDLGLVAVQGDNQVSTSADSNGSGKSYLIEGPPWALFGETIRGVSGDAVVNRAAGKDCFVTLTIALDGGEELTVTRYRKHKVEKNALRIFVDGVEVTKGTMKETEAALVELVGLDFEAFKRAVYFDGANIVPFPTLADKDVKAIFERVLGLEDLTKVLDRAKKEARELDANLASVESRRLLAASEAATAASEAMIARQRRDDFERGRAKDIADRETRIRDLKINGGAIDPGALAAREKEVVDEEAKLLGMQDKLKNLHAIRSTYEFELGEHRRAVAVADSARITAERDLGTVELVVDPGIAAKLMNADSHWRRAKEAVDGIRHTIDHAEARVGTDCTECGKAITAGDLHAVISAQKVGLIEAERILKNRTEDLAAARSERDAWVAKRRSDLDAQRRAAEAEMARLAGIEDALVKRGAEIASLEKMSQDVNLALAAMPGKRAAIASMREREQTTRAAIAGVEGEIEDLRTRSNPFGPDITRWDERKQQGDEKELEALNELAALKKRRKLYEVIERAYGRSGVKAHILENVTPVLNARANDYAGQLADGAVKIEFNTLTRNKDGSLAERFSVGVTNALGADGYLGNSTGERRKIDLAIGLAISDVCAARSAKALDLFVADEVMTGLDDTARERIAELLQRKAGERGTILALAPTDISGMIPTTIMVRRTAGGSAIA